MKKIFSRMLLMIFLAVILFSVNAYADPMASSIVSMFRLYNPNSGEHFYTANKSEKNSLISVGWKYEGIGWFAPKTSKTPVYRLYNKNAGDHHYTTNKKEKDWLVGLGWNYEGIGWYSDDNKQVPIYRQYNPNAISGAHNFTSNKGEVKGLVKAGWKDEGISWYGLDVSNISKVIKNHASKCNICGQKKTIVDFNYDYEKLIDYFCYDHLEYHVKKKNAKNYSTTDSWTELKVPYATDANTEVIRVIFPKS